METKYNPTDIEQKWYDYWLEHKFFHSEPDEREPYTVVIPPPNVTGVLHMGHMLNNTIQDILVRHARMTGKNACWVPGTDHASIATEAKVVNRLAQQGIKKTDLTREKFLEHAWDWTNEHGGIILKQLRKLGASCDWDRTAFTMDESRSESVMKVFCDLYNKGLIYRGVRMVNWDPKALTALSDEEVIFKEHQGKLYYLKYYVAANEQCSIDESLLDEGNICRKDEKGYYALVATTRPETIMGDTAMCINPNDPKNTWLKGKHVIVPLVGREIPVIEDDYVDTEFGTGCLKVTPAHDVNDYMLGEKYSLPSIDIFNDNGTLSEAAGMYIGMDRFDCREQIEHDLQDAGLLEKAEAYTNNVGFSERTNVPIEPKLSMQWFLRMEHFADMVLAPVMNDEIRFYPAKYKNTYRHWIENIKDWCISRQLWWGHRIPAYYYTAGTGEKSYPGGYVVAATAEQALQLAQEKTGNTALTLNDLRQDEDCLDTWFSSWLWPISLFDGINNPGNKEMQYYYPTCDLVTGPDIIFFWVARMIMAGYEYEGKMPFRNVYFTGIVRDKLGRKMSKSLGNSPDPLDLIDKFGADGVRMGMMLSAPAGNDILFDESLCEQGRNFNNKIWNAFRLVKGWDVAETEQPAYAKLACDWFAAKLTQTANEMEDLFGKYRISEALMAIYKLFWDEFSSWYLEMVKPAYGQPIDATTYRKTLAYFEQLLQLLHPFMPFITEELWQNLTERKAGESIMVTQIAVAPPAESDIIAEMETLKAIIAGIRTIRLQRNIPQKESLALQAIRQNRFSEGEASVISKLCNLSEIEYVAQKAEGSTAFMADATEYAIQLGSHINVEEELQKLQADLTYQEGFLQNVLKKLGNERFVQNAKPEVVALERKKQADAESRIATLKESIAALQK
ncbi:MAG: valine--tRNA ligase [Paludibacter sp.]|nr:valine--tRNA ligase [Bacteroidales bacterium]MCM1068888.1 valine--tRNA ligase [Prevotella sp.]MCM1353149.1 valine--tRNA ligase [Bacteroides sp.]MCM1442471.1 valine--tRNA ligase [Muribaculum sp.]MCM1481314.1 valine--tRNA ligase [Paludibacter sp.]